jgi:hypothetical protein
MSEVIIIVFSILITLSTFISTFLIIKHYKMVKFYKESKECSEAYWQCILEEKDKVICNCLIRLDNEIDLSKSLEEKLRKFEEDLDNPSEEC